MEYIKRGMKKDREKILEVKNLTKDYGSGPILDGISFDVHRGEVIVIVGPSGCGKSSLLRCMNGLESIQSGSIYLDGVDITFEKTNWSMVRKKVGMVFQNYDLFPHMTVINNLILGPSKVHKEKKEDIKKRAELLLERVGLLNKKDVYPRELSGGQKQRVAIVRALMMKPEVLLFDEVTAALDPEMVREVLDVMLELATSGSTMLIVTHEMQFARAVADKVIFIENGKIIEEDEAERFFNEPKTERAYQFLNTFKFERGERV